MIFRRKELIVPITSSVLMLFFYMYKLDIVFLIGTIGILSTVFFIKTQNLIKIYYFLLPNIMLFKYDRNSMAILSIYMILIFIRVIILRKHIQLSYKLLVSVLLYLIISLLSYIYAGNGILTIVPDLRIIIDIFVFVLILKNIKGDRIIYFKEIVESLVLGIIFTAIFSVVNLLLLEVSVFQVRISPINNDPNYFATVISVTISLLLVNIYILKEFTIKNLILIVMLFIVGLLTQSRAFIVSNFFNILLLGNILLVKSYNKKKTKIILGTIIVLFLTVFHKSLTKMINNIVFRFTDAEYSGGGGRLDIWKFYLDSFFRNAINFIIGIGDSQKFRVNEGIRHIQHNMFLEILTSKGILGFISFMILVKRIANEFYKSRKINKYTIISAIPILTLMISVIFINGMKDDLVIMTLLLSLYSRGVYLKIIQERIK